MEYALPQSVDEALSILNSESNATVFAGATDLIPQLRGGRPEPGLIVDLKKIPGLVDLSFSNGIEELEVEATSVKSLIAEMDRRYPGIADGLESGFALAIDGEIISNPGYEKLTEVSEVRFLSPMQGGGNNFFEYMDKEFKSFLSV